MVNLRPRQDFCRIQTGTSTGAYNYVLWPDHQLSAAHDTFHGDYAKHTSSRPSVEINQRPDDPRFIHPESERLMPSVEHGPHALGGQGLGLEGDGPGPIDRPFPDQFLGPRIVELGDDPKTPASKRRRIGDVDWLSADLKYHSTIDPQSPGSALVPSRPSRHDGYPDPGAGDAAQPQSSQFYQSLPRRVELVPIHDQVHNGVYNGAMNALAQHRGGLPAREVHTMQPSPRMRPELESHVDAPLRQAQFRSREEMSGLPAAYSTVPNSQPHLDTHRPQQPLRFPYANASRLHVAATITGVPHPSHSVRDIPLRTKPLHPNDNIISNYRSSIPVMGQSFGTRDSIRSSDAESKGCTYRPAHHGYDHVRTVRQDSQPSELLPPWNPPGRDQYLFTHESDARMSRNLRTIDHRTMDPNREVVYITSSPPVGER
ncbi:MAG: hypothetical protein Q9166_006806 [cf. Caloplaca sp. 2 TL-2023]